MLSKYSDSTANEHALFKLVALIKRLTPRYRLISHVASVEIQAPYSYVLTGPLWAPDSSGSLPTALPGLEQPALKCLTQVNSGQCSTGAPHPLLRNSDRCPSNLVSISALAAVELIN